MSGMLSNSATRISNGRKTVASAGTAEALATSNTRIVSVQVTAETDNTGYVVVGASDVVAALATRKGHPLAAGDAVTLDIDQLSKVYIDSEISTDGVTYIALGA